MPDRSETKEEGSSTSGNAGEGCGLMGCAGVWGIVIGLGVFVVSWVLNRATRGADPNSMFPLSAGLGTMLIVFFGFLIYFMLRFPDAVAHLEAFLKVGIVVVVISALIIYAIMLALRHAGYL